MRIILIILAVLFGVLYAGQRVAFGEELSYMGRWTYVAGQNPQYFGGPTPPAGIVRLSYVQGAVFFTGFSWYVTGTSSTSDLVIFNSADEYIGGLPGLTGGYASATAAQTANVGRWVEYAWFPGDGKIKFPNIGIATASSPPLAVDLWWRPNIGLPANAAQFVVGKEAADDRNTQLVWAGGTRLKFTHISGGPPAGSTHRPMAVPYGIADGHFPLPRAGDAPLVVEWPGSSLIVGNRLYVAPGNPVGTTANMPAGSADAIYRVEVTTDEVTPQDPCTHFYVTPAYWDDVPQTVLENLVAGKYYLHYVGGTFSGTAPYTAYSHLVASGIHWYMPTVYDNPPVIDWPGGAVKVRVGQSGAGTGLMEWKLCPAPVEATPTAPDFTSGNGPGNPGAGTGGGSGWGPNPGGGGGGDPDPDPDPDPTTQPLPTPPPTGSGDCVVAAARIAYGPRYFVTLAPGNYVVKYHQDDWGVLNSETGVRTSLSKLAPGSWVMRRAGFTEVVATLPGSDVDGGGPGVLEVAFAVPAGSGNVQYYTTFSGVGGENPATGRAASNPGDVVYSPGGLPSDPIEWIYGSYVRFMICRADGEPVAPVGVPGDNNGDNDTTDPGDDSDGDGDPNVTDPDDDNDGTPDEEDDAPYDPDPEAPPDRDGDEIPDDDDDDDDNDDVPDDDDDDDDNDGTPDPQDPDHPDYDPENPPSTNPSTNPTTQPSDPEDMIDNDDDVPSINEVRDELKLFHEDMNAALGNTDDGSQLLELLEQIRLNTAAATQPAAEEPDPTDPDEDMDGDEIPNHEDGDADGDGCSIESHYGDEGPEGPEYRDPNDLNAAVKCPYHGGTTPSTQPGDGGDGDPTTQPGTKASTVTTRPAPSTMPADLQPVQDGELTGEEGNGVITFTIPASKLGQGLSQSGHGTITTQDIEVTLSPTWLPEGWKQPISAVVIGLCHLAGATMVYRALGRGGK